MEGKKISFGFKKTKKADLPVHTAEDEKKEFIECMEEKSIKIVGGETTEENKPLIIPMKPNTLITAEKLKEIAEKVESSLEEPEIKKEPTNNDDMVKENETLDQMAVRELLQDAKEIKVEVPSITIPTPAKPVFEGEKESTLDDYESVPIQQFGMAMLRGMGWTPNNDGSKYKQPELRPKGLGLGADKVIKENQKKHASKDSKDQDLTIVQNSFVKIVTGKYHGYYGKVVSLDEDNGRVMVDIPVKKETVSLSEFMLLAISKSEYDKESKVINADSFQEYKKNEKLSQKSREEDKASTSRNNRDINTNNDSDGNNKDSRKQEDQNSSNGRSRMKEREKRYSSSSEERSSTRRKQNKKRYSSSDSLGSLSDHGKKKKKHKSKKHRRSSESSDSRSRSPPRKTKRDIDKKRKGKKKKRDRDRSPNYKKHRK